MDSLEACAMTKASYFLLPVPSLQIFSFGMGSGTQGLELLRHDCNINSEQVKKLGPGVLSNTTNAGINPEFPLDFFEKTSCITTDMAIFACRWNVSPF